MDDILWSPYTNIDCGSLEVHQETIEELFELKDCDGAIKDILTTTLQPHIINKYVFRSQNIDTSKPKYSYRMKLLVNLRCNFEYTAMGDLGETKFLSKEKLFNVTFPLPDKYEDGMPVTITPQLIDTSSKLLNPTSIYLSSFLTFTALV